MGTPVRIIAILMALLVLIPIAVHKRTSYPVKTVFADDTIAVPNPDPSITQPMPVNAIITKPDGTIVEQQYIYDPSTTTINIDSGYGGENASIFIPAFSLGFLWAEGNWVDYDGYYWHNNNWVYANHDNWNNHWNNYWHNNWNNNNWHNHWQNNQNNGHWNNQNHPEHWNQPGGRAQGGRDGHDMGGRRGGGAGGRGGGGGGHR